ncbi:MAG: 3-oxoacyl-ACP reductase FabG [Gammaproteobacteria bacterium]|nr:3-oxoacyl-ACP reductase FabG [Gammaproteobacteria bacterium]
MKKCALVTGGSGNIGAAICQQLAKQGLHIIVHAKQNLQRANTLVETIKKNQGSAESIIFDINDQQATADAMVKIITHHTVQVLVHNAGIHCDSPMAGMSYTDWQHVININLNGFFTVAQPLLLPMMRTRWGRIIAISSIAAKLGNRGQTNYAAAKAGLHGTVKSLALEVASRGITVNTVAPGIIDTQMSQNNFPAEKIKQLVPMQRAGTPQEVADLVGFLASDQSTYISGQLISIDGAMS